VVIIVRAGAEIWKPEHSYQQITSSTFSVLLCHCQFSSEKL